MSNNLQIPHFQQKVDEFCLPACVQMVLAFWGIQREQVEIAKELGTIPNAGTPGSRLRRLQSPLIEITYGEGTLPDLEAALTLGIPPITLVYTGELPYWKIAFAHAVVVTGMDSDFITVNDPAQEESAIQVTVADFQLAWDEMANLYSLLQRKQK